MPCSLVTCLAVTEVNRSALLCPCQWPWWSWVCQCRLQIPIALKNRCQVQSSLMMAYQKHHARSSGPQILLRKCQTLESSRAFNTGFPASGKKPATSSRRNEQVLQEVIHTRKTVSVSQGCTWLGYLLHGTVFINSRQNLTRYDVHNMAYTMDIIRTANLEYWPQIFDFSNSSVNSEV